MARLLSGAAAAVLVLACVTAPGDNGATADRTLTDSVVMLERAVHALAGPSADFSKVLQDVVSAWPARGAAFVKTDLATFLARVPDARSDFQCAADFVRDRARLELLRLKDVLLNADPQAAQPRFCNAMPFVVDPVRAAGAVEIYGYDFDREPVVQVLLMDGFGFRDVTFAVVRRAHYHLTLDLEKNGLKFSPGNQRLALAVGHLIQHAIPVLQAGTRLCESRIEVSPAGKTIGYDPPLLDGRGAFSGGGARVLASAALDYESNQVTATFCMTAVEDTESRRASSGCAAELIYSSDPDRVIEGIVGSGLEAHVAYQHGDKSEGVLKGADDGPVDRWIFTGLGGRGSRVLEPRIAVRLRAIRVISTRIDGCVSPIAYLEARRSRTLSGATIQRLDPQLRRIDPAILNERPRWSPPAGRLE